MTSPMPTGSLTKINTIGIVLVIFFRATKLGALEDKMTSGCAATSSAAYVWIRLGRPAVQR